MVPDPVHGNARRVAYISVLDGDTGPTANPRAELLTSLLLGVDDDVWVGFGWRFPSDWPTIPAVGWVTLGEVAGPPFGGTNPVRLGFDEALIGGGSFGILLQESASSPWSTPVVKDQWFDVAMRMKLSEDPAVGFIELWLNTGDGWEQQLLDGVPRLHVATLNAINNDGSGQRYKPSLYRKAGMVSTLSAYLTDFRIGSSLDAVDPRSYGAY
jgi:hypothetical protein